MKWLLTNHHAVTYGFFAGLVAASILVPWGMISKRVLSGWGALIFAALLVVFLAEVQSPAEKLQRAEQRYALKQASTFTPGVNAQLHTPEALLYLGAGAVAASAMILPGVSGSFMLVLMGVYFDVITAIVDRRLSVLLMVAIGAVLGLLLLSKLLGYLLKAHRDNTMMSLTGLMMGSLYGLWPFQSYQIVGGRRVLLEPVMPQSIQETLVVGGFFVLGVVIVLAFLKLAPAEAQASKTLEV